MLLPAHIIAAIIKAERERAELLRKQDEARPRIYIERPEDEDEVFIPRRRKDDADWL